MLLVLCDILNNKCEWRNKNMKWATRKNMQVDRVSSVWLIKRFIDEEAEFSFVSDEEIGGLTQQGILTFDAKDAKYKHLEDPIRGKYGEKCTFQVIMESYGLSGKDKALDYFAKIIYAADIAHRNNEFIPHEGFGVWAIAKGFSMTHPNDEDKLKCTLPIYDALYEYCRYVVKT